MSTCDQIRMISFMDPESITCYVYDDTGKSVKLNIALKDSVGVLYKKISQNFDIDESDYEIYLQKCNGHELTMVPVLDKQLHINELDIKVLPNSHVTFTIRETSTARKKMVEEDTNIAEAETNSTHEEDTNITEVETNSTQVRFVGLVNQAMTCYLNSLLQALYMTPEFRNALYNWAFDGDTPEKSIPYQLQKLFVNLQTSPKAAIETTELTRSFGWDMSDSWQQHDIQELCRVMFDALEQKFKDTAQADLIARLYQGQMNDYVKCLQCGTMKSRLDTFLDLPLPVRPYGELGSTTSGGTRSYGDVREALRAFIQPELLDGVNQYLCERCGRMCDAHKGLELTRIPYLLTLHLKRFDFDYNTMHRIKLNDKITFPETLDLNEFVTGTNCNNNRTTTEQENNEEKSMDLASGDNKVEDVTLDPKSHETLLEENKDNHNMELSSAENDESLSSGDNKMQDTGAQIENKIQNAGEKNNGPYVYELFAIMVHSGSASGGHYYVYIKDLVTKKWYCFDDQSVTPITEEDIQKTYGGSPYKTYYNGAYTSSTNAYMLMYRQIDKSRNVSFIKVADFPEHIKILHDKLKEKQQTEIFLKEKELDMYKIRLFVPNIGQNPALLKALTKIPETKSEETPEELKQNCVDKKKYAVSNSLVPQITNSEKNVSHTKESTAKNCVISQSFSEKTSKCEEISSKQLKNCIHETITTEQNCVEELTAFAVNSFETSTKLEYSSVKQEKISDVIVMNERNIRRHVPEATVEKVFTNKTKKSTIISSKTDSACTLHENGEKFFKIFDSTKNSWDDNDDGLIMHNHVENSEKSSNIIENCVHDDRSKSENKSSSVEIYNNASEIIGNCLNDTNCEKASLEKPEGQDNCLSFTKTAEYMYNFGSNFQFVEMKIYLHCDTTFSEALQEAYKRSKVQSHNIDMEQCRLVNYNAEDNMIEESFEKYYDDKTIAEILTNINSATRYDWLLEIRDRSEVFPKYYPGGRGLGIYYVDINTQDIYGPEYVRAFTKQTILQFYKVLYKLFDNITGFKAKFKPGEIDDKIEKLDLDEHIIEQKLEEKSEIVFALENYNDKFSVFDHTCDKLEFLSTYLVTGKNKVFVTKIQNTDENMDKFRRVLEKFANLVAVDVVLPLSDKLTLEVLSIPSLDTNDNSTPEQINFDHEISPRDASQVMGSVPVWNCTQNSDQSNSEDSSLSDSDRTLIGDGPEVRYCSSNSSSPGSMSEHRCTNMLFKDDFQTNRSFIIETANIPNLEKIENQDVSGNILRLLVDKTKSVLDFKKYLQGHLNVSVEFIKIFKQTYQTLFELTNLYTLKNYDRLNIKLDKVLRENQVSGKIYQLHLNNPESPSKFLTDFVITKGETVLQTKLALIKLLKVRENLNFAPEYLRLRRKAWKSPTKIYADHESFGNEIMIHPNYEIFLQDIRENSESSTKDTLFGIFVRQWKPSTLTLGDCYEIMLESNKLSDLRDKLSALSNIPANFISIALLKGNFPYNVSVLSIETELRWINDTEGNLMEYPLNIFEDGAAILYKDWREELKQLRPEEREEILSKESKSNLKYSNKSPLYSPRKEKALKIYLDTSPTKQPCSADID